jgi:hypothetical protein
MLLTNIDGLEHLGFYFFFTIYLWVFIILAVIEIKIMVLNKKNSIKKSLISNNVFSMFFLLSFIFIVYTIIKFNPYP